MPLQFVPIEVSRPHSESHWGHATRVYFIFFDSNFSVAYFVHRGAAAPTEESLNSCAFLLKRRVKSAKSNRFLCQNVHAEVRAQGVICMHVSHYVGLWEPLPSGCGDSRTAPPHPPSNGSR